MVAEVRIEPDRRQFARVIRALEDEADGNRLRADIAESFESLLEGVVDEQRSGLMSMSTGGLEHAGEPLRNAISDRITVDVRIAAGKSGGARIRVLKSGMPRSFLNAAKRTNERSWRRQVYGRDIWVTQISGAYRWFDDPIDNNRARFRVAAKKALDDVAQRIDRKT